jgi:hypothetical protein
MSTKVPGGRTYICKLLAWPFTPHHHTKQGVLKGGLQQLSAISQVTHSLYHCPTVDLGDDQRAGW